MVQNQEKRTAQQQKFSLAGQKALTKCFSFRSLFKPLLEGTCRDWLLPVKFLWLNKLLTPCKISGENISHREKRLTQKGNEFTFWIAQHCWKLNILQVHGISSATESFEWKTEYIQYN